MPNAILERIRQVIGNLVRHCNFTQTYVDKYYPWLEILAASEFAILSTKNWLKGYSLGQLVFGRDMSPLIKNMVGWWLLRQQKQVQINKDNIRRNRNRVDHNYNGEDKVMPNNHDA